MKEVESSRIKDLNRRAKKNKNNNKIKNRHNNGREAIFFYIKVL